MGAMSEHEDKRKAARDVLAAEEFGMGTADPRLHEQSPHDVLAADEFEVGTGDPALGRGSFDVPDSPSAGAGPPREVLAADAFAVPAGRAPLRAHAGATVGSRRGRLLALGAAAAFVVVRRLRRRG
jgi:hypothetical protein